MRQLGAPAALVALVAAACGGNRPPVAANDTAAVPTGGSVLVDVLANDSDPDGDPLELTAVGEPVFGHAVVEGEAVRYTAPEGFAGADSFGYEIADGRGGTDSATVTVTVGVVEPENHAPVAVDDLAEGLEGTLVRIADVLANDFDEDGDTLALASHSEPEHGVLTAEGEGAFDYRPAADWNGTDSFTYLASDGRGGTATATVTIVVHPSGLDLYVAPDGDDGAAGTLDAPLASLEAARDRVRALRAASGEPEGGFAVWLRGGVYERRASFALSAEDSGSARAPVLFAAYPGERPRLVGAARLDPRSFEPVTAESAPGVWHRLDEAARGSLVQADLSALAASFGAHSPRGFGSWGARPVALELFVEGERMQLARWPDFDEAFPWTRVVGTAGDRAFTYEGTRPERWLEAEDLWLHGYWMHMWADRHVAVAALDAGSRTVTLAEVPGYGLAAGQPYYALNLLEELTAPGEHYLDRATGVLYLYPAAPLEDATEVFVSVLEEPLVSVEGAAHVTFRAIAFEMARGALVRVEGGDHVVLERCVLRNAGLEGAAVSGTDSGLERCEVAHTGHGGVRLSGGDRPSLARGRNFVRNSEIHHFGRWSWTYTPGVDLRGVGHAVSHNHLHDAPHSAVLFGGNEHFVEYNLIHDVCLWASDAGAIYAGRDWGYRGNRVQFNFIHDLDSQFEGYGVHGVYLDDCVSGIRVFGNVIYRVSGHGIQHGGGRDVLMQNNVVARCGDALAADSRGLVRIVHDGSDWDLLQKIVEVGYRREPWASTYPELARIPESWAEVSDPAARWLYPEGSVFSRNVSFENGRFMTSWDPGPVRTFEVYAEVADNLDGVDPLFVDEGSLDLELAPGSPALALPGFVPIPFDQIGVLPE